MHCEIIACYINIYFVEIQLKKENLKSVFWVPRPVYSLPNSLNMSLTVATYYYTMAKQKNATCVTIFHCQFIQKCKFFIFDKSYMVGKLSFSSNRIKKTFLDIFSDILMLKN